MMIIKVVYMCEAGTFIAGTSLDFPVQNKMIKVVLKYQSGSLLLELLGNSVQNIIVSSGVLNTPRSILFGKLGTLHASASWLGRGGYFT